MNLEVVGLDGGPFIWRRGRYLLKGDYFILKGKTFAYKPDFSRLCEVLASMDENDLPRFMNEYGPLGVWGYFLRTGNYESYVRFNEPVDEPPRLKWDRLFGLILEEPKENGLLAFNPKDEKSFWRVYREPLSLAELALAEYRHAVKALLEGKHHYAQRLKLEHVNGKLVCRCASLLEGIYARLLWDSSNGKVFKECEGRGRGYEGCEKCRYYKAFFWRSTANNKFGRPDCKVYQKVRAKSYRLGGTKKTPARSKRVKALELYGQGVSVADIAERFHVKETVVDRWLKEGQKKLVE